MNFSRYDLEKIDILPAGIEHLFVAEGQSEVGMLNAILAKERAPAAAKILCSKGKDNISALVKRMLSQRVSKSVRSITIVCDADNNPLSSAKKCWKSLLLSKKEQQNGKDNGCVISQDGRRYVVWLSPGCGKAGAIEDMVLETIARNVRDRIRNFWRDNQKASENKEVSAKAMVAIWLALKANEGMGLGTAFMKGLIDLDHAVFRPLRELVRAQLGHTRP